MEMLSIRKMFWIASGKSAPNTHGRTERPAQTSRESFLYGADASGGRKSVGFAGLWPCLYSGAARLLLRQDPVGPRRLGCRLRGFRRRDRIADVASLRQGGWWRYDSLQVWLIEPDHHQML